MIESDRGLSAYKEEVSFGENCGVVGIKRLDNLAPIFANKGLATLQHRGQENAGMAVYDDGENSLKGVRGVGLVSQVLNADALDSLGGSAVAIGHVRYATSGKRNALQEVANSQPFIMSENGYSLSLGHNGNLTNPEWFKDRLVKPIDATSDSGYLTAYLLQSRPNYDSWEETLQTELQNAQGAYCIVAINEQQELLAFRDPRSMHPLTLGKFKEGGYAIASETVALNIVNAEYKRPIDGGEIVKITADGAFFSYPFGSPARSKGCLFERFYFMRPDSFDGDFDKRIRAGREDSGKLLAERISNKKYEEGQQSINADSVVPVFDSGYPAAKGTALGLDLPLKESITTSHYVGRTFIQPGQEQRINALNGKHNFTPEVAGEVVIYVDDSNVRGNTGKKVTKGLREDSGALQVHAGYGSPPVKKICLWGVDLPSQEELPAAEFAGQPLEKIEEAMAKKMGANSVTYLPLAETARAFAGTTEDFCTHCFTGERPDKQDRFPQKERQINEKPKIALLISETEPTRQIVTDRVNDATIRAEIVSMDLTRVTDKQTIIENLLGKNIDLVVCAGLSDAFDEEVLQKLQEEEVAVINLHQALLPKKPNDHVMTSKGQIPVIEGENAITEAYEKKLRVSGVTVHQLLPDKSIYGGPVILREEVPLRNEESIESFQDRIHESEMDVLPTAINKVLHVMKHNIDISKGTFPW